MLGVYVAHVARARIQVAGLVTQEAREGQLASVDEAFERARVT